MNPLLGCHHQEASSSSFSSNGNFYGKRSLQSFDHGNHPDTRLHKRSTTPYHYTTTTPTTQQPPMQQNRPPVVPPQNPSHVEPSLWPTRRVPAIPALPLQPLQKPGFVPPPATQTTVDMNNNFMISTLLRELISVADNNKPLQAVSPNMLPEGLVDFIIINCWKQPTVDDDDMGLEFNHAKLKVRNESVIRSLYADLPRQCATCGLRFKAQEEHAQHLDWHVRKNRAAKKNIKPTKTKNTKYKQIQSQKWFPTSSLLLKASEINSMRNAQAPAFISTATVKEENNCEEALAVFADVDQKECPLCMEAFEDYFSNETEDWMYRGTVYINEARASTRRLYKSLVGRIVHAECLYTKEEMQSSSHVSR